jgi:hypothetical protein
MLEETYVRRGMKRTPCIMLRLRGHKVIGTLHWVFRPPAIYEGLWCGLALFCGLCAMAG